MTNQVEDTENEGEDIENEVEHQVIERHHCKYCLAKLEDTAKYCSSCNHYQDWFRNAVRYYAAPIIFSLGVIYWTVQFGFQSARQYRESVRELTCNPILEDTTTLGGGKTFLTNAGETPLLIKSLHFRCKKLSRSMNVDLMQSLAAEHVVLVPHGQRDMNTEFAFGLTDEEAIEAFANGDPNYDLAYVFDDSPVISDLETADVPVFKANVDMHYRNLFNGEQDSDSYSVAAVVMKKKAPEVTLVGQWLASPDLNRPSHMVLDIQIVNNENTTMIAYCVNLNVVAEGVLAKGVKETKLLEPSAEYYAAIPDLKPGMSKELPVLVNQSIESGDTDRFQVHVYLPTCFSVNGMYNISATVDSTAGQLKCASLELPVRSELVEIKEFQEL